MKDFTSFLFLSLTLGNLPLIARAIPGNVLNRSTCIDGTYVMSNQASSYMVYNDCQRYCNDKFNGTILDFGAENESFITHYLTNCFTMLSNGVSFWAGPCKTIRLEGTSIKKEKVDDCTRNGSRDFAHPICELPQLVQRRQTTTAFPVVSHLSHTTKLQKPSAPAKNSSVYDRWLDFNLHVQYYITSNTSSSQGDCGMFCSTLDGSRLAENETADPVVMLSDVLDRNMAYWVNVSEGITMVTGNNKCSALISCPSSRKGCRMGEFFSFFTKCSDSFNCICERNYSANTTSSERTPLIIDHEMYFIIQHEQNYTAAKSHCCEVYNATLVAFSNTLAYMRVLEKLNLSHDLFWIGANGARDETFQNDCLAYNGKVNAISMTACTEERYSVCSRSVYTQEEMKKAVEQDPKFNQMLSEMTVDRKETVKSKRKVTSVEDHRATSNALGAVSAVLLAAVVSLVILVDLPRLRHLIIH